MSLLKAIQILNGLLILGANFLPVAQRVGTVIENSIATGNSDIPDEEWRWAIDYDTEAMAELKQSIEDAQLGK